MWVPSSEEPITFSFSLLYLTLKIHCVKIHLRQIDKSPYNPRRAVGSVELIVARLVTFSQFYGTRKFTAASKMVPVLRRDKIFYLLPVLRKDCVEKISFMRDYKPIEIVVNTPVF
jgi:hypothetical protein